MRGVSPPHRKTELLVFGMPERIALSEPLRHDGLVRSVSFSSDGRALSPPGTTVWFASGKFPMSLPCPGLGSLSGQSLWQESTTPDRMLESSRWNGIQSAATTAGCGEARSGRLFQSRTLVSRVPGLPGANASSDAALTRLVDPCRNPQHHRPTAPGRLDRWDPLDDVGLLGGLEIKCLSFLSPLLAQTSLTS